MGLPKIKNNQRKNSNKITDVQLSLSTKHYQKAKMPAKKQQHKGKKIMFIEIITLSLAIQLLITLLILYISLTSIVTETSIRLTHDSTQNLVEKIDLFLDSLQRHNTAIAVLAQRKSIPTHHQQLAEIIWSHLHSAPFIHSIHIGDPQQNYLVLHQHPQLSSTLINRAEPKPVAITTRLAANYSPLNITRHTTDYQPTTQHWYQHAEAWLDAHLIESTNTFGIAVTHPLRDSDGNSMGQVATYMQLTEFNRFIKTLHNNPKSIILIINDQQELIACSICTALAEKSPDDGSLGLRPIAALPERWLNTIYLKYQQSSQTIIKANGGHYMMKVFNFAKGSQINWRIVFIVPAKDWLADADNKILLFLGVFIIINVLALFFAYAVTTQISHEIDETIKHIAKLGSFQFSPHPLPASRLKEVFKIQQITYLVHIRLKNYKPYINVPFIKAVINAQQNQTWLAKRNLMVLISHVDKFNNLAEQIPAEVLSQHIAAYFKMMNECITMQHGVIDRFAGGVTIAFWGAPSPLANAPQRACYAALNCQSCLQQFNERLKTDALMQPMCLTQQIGIHCGELMVGNLGFQDRLFYTIWGDQLSFAAGLERINAYYGTRIIISDTVYTQIGERFYCRKLDKLIRAEYPQGIWIYELIGDRTYPLSTQQQGFISHYETALAHFFNQQYAPALEIFNQLRGEFPQDKSVQVFVNRCAQQLEEEKII